ncbi:hypothetical protein [Streptomyces sp. NPDC046261]|uniref:hypothetical protein n=1 Tax=Streptomyces sp. NPDC046261 TaxID=3157200 RepID=UPI0033CD3F60
MRAARPVLRMLLVCAGALLACTALNARALPVSPDRPPAHRANGGPDGSGGFDEAPVTLVARTAAIGPARCVRRAGPGHPVLRCRLERVTFTGAVVTVRTGDHPTTARIAHAALAGAVEVDLTRFDGKLAGLLPVRVTAGLPLPVAAAPALELTEVTLAADRVVVARGRVGDALFLIRS